MNILTGKCKEDWVDVIGYDGSYSVSNKGRVRSNSRVIKNGKNTSYMTKTKELKLSKHLNGYLFVRLCKKGKDKYHSIHRLVAIHFIMANKLYLDVNHKDGNKQNNSVDNLEWLSRSENVIHALENGLANRESISVKVIATNVISKDKLYFKSMREAERNGFIQSSISACVNGKQKTHKGFKWRKQENKQ